jgi:hypothetical protein
LFGAHLAAFSKPNLDKIRSAVYVPEKNCGKNEFISSVRRNRSRKVGTAGRRPQADSCLVEKYQLQEIRTASQVKVHIAKCKPELQVRLVMKISNF